MDFFARQDASRRSTRWLVLTFGLAFFAVALATAIVVAIGFGLIDANSGILSTTAGGRLPAAPGIETIALVTAVTMGLMIVASLFRTATLARGGGQVATMLGGTRITGDTQDALHRRLLNVVEEMAIASGLPVPEVYVLEREAGINAFAAGLSHGDAAIAVTRGCLEQLTRAELSGVIGHEFSHILNGDMRLNLRLMGFGFGILVLSLLGRWLLRGARFSGRSRGRGIGGIALVGLGLTIIGGVGVLLSRLIKAAVSRRREVLADASAVQFTREPLALAGALKKIGGFTTYLTAVDAEEVSHMLFGRGAAGFRGWFATHPPLVERIRALDPSFDGRFPPPGAALPGVDTTEDFQTSALRGGAGPQHAALAGAIAGAATRATAAGTAAAATTGATLRAAIPEDLVAAARSHDNALLLIVGIALAGDNRSAALQTRLLEAQLGPRRTALCVRYRQTLATLDRRLWLPLVELAVPALRRRPQPQIEFLLDLIDRLIRIDADLSLFEYSLSRLLHAYLAEPGRGRTGKPLAEYDAWFTLLATVAVLGHADAAAAGRAYREGLPELPPRARAAAEGVFRSIAAAPDLGQIDAAIDSLAGARGERKRAVLAALERTIRYDKAIGVTEAELFRTIAAAIGCPIPPGEG